MPTANLFVWSVIALPSIPPPIADGWIKTIVVDASGTLLAAVLGTVAVAQFKALRLSLRLWRIARLFRHVRVRSSSPGETTSRLQFCGEAKEELEEIKRDIDVEVHGRIFTLSRGLLRKIAAIGAEIQDAQETILSDRGLAVLYPNMIPPRAADEAKALERKVRRMALRAAPFWVFFLP